MSKAEMLEHLERLERARRRAGEARAAHLRSRLAPAIRRLRELGARRVVLFGSLAAGRPHAESDVDLATEGLPATRLFEAMAEAAAIVGADVDIVRLEDAPPSLRDRIEAEGEGAMSTRARLQRLRAEVMSDRDAALGQIAELERIPLGASAARGDLAHAAVALHHGYGAVEALLLRISRELGEGEPAGPDWHQTLLHTAGLDIEGVRPAILRQETIRLLRRLLGFRHFFRHAYSVSLDGRQLASLRDDALALQPLLESDLDRLDDLLRKLADAATA